MENNGQPNKKSKWTIASSLMARRTYNPIRAVVDGMKLEPNPEKELISLSIGKVSIKHTTVLQAVSQDFN